MAGAVLNVFMRRDRFIVITETTVSPSKTSVYSLGTKSCLATFDTFQNPSGIGAVSYNNAWFVLALLDLEQGSVRVYNFNTKETKTAQLHQSPLSLLAIDFNGKLGASASQLGTVVRVFNCEDLAVLYELRRGHSVANMTSLSFSPSQEFLCGTSDHCTLHVWQLKDLASTYVGDFLTYVSSSFKFVPSVSKLRIHQNELRTDERCKLTGPVAHFFTDTQIAVACLDGTLHKVTFDPTSFTSELADSLSYLEDDQLLRQSIFEVSA